MGRRVLSLAALLVWACGPQPMTEPSPTLPGPADAISWIADAALFPDAPPPTDECGDGLDGDGNGLIDDMCPCTAKDMQACFPGPAAARNQGACRDGAQTCESDSQGEFGAWGSCEGAQGPGTEVCDEALADEDCDGAANEGCDCVPGSPPVPCGTDEGECSPGLQECVGGMLGACTGAVGPSAEACDGLDNNCDGTIDEGLVVACGSSIGACVPGTSTCVAGAWQTCAGAVGPTGEACNGIDDDCNGTIDDGVTTPCGTDEGACVAGTSVCTDGAWGACDGIGPTLEACNGIDDNCDGSIDEGCLCLDGATRPCGSDVGACEPGTQTCGGGAWGPCTGGVAPGFEACGNGTDDNCDGAVDEGCTPPVVSCPGNINTTPLATVTLSGSGSDPDGGPVTFAWTVTSRPPGSSSNPASPTSPTTTFFVDLAGTYTIRLTVTDDEGLSAWCSLTVTAVPLQDLHVELVWNTAYGDVDLHLVQAGLGPDGYWFTSEPDCFYGNTSASWPPGGPAGNASLDIDDMDGYGPENINIDNSPGAGTYAIGVAYYCSHGLARTPSTPIAPGDGPTTATVNVYCGGVLVATYPGISLDRTGRFVDLARVTWPGCAGMSVNDRTWTALVQPPAFVSPLHCSLPCTNNGDCGGGEVCAAGVCALD